MARFAATVAETSMISIKRIYEPVRDSDGFRILIDRLWPRGIKKETGAIDVWLKDIAPSTELRKWIHSKPDKWEEFEARYLQELSKNETAMVLKDLVAKHQKITLLYASRDELRNHARILKNFLETT